MKREMKKWIMLAFALVAVVTVVVCSPYIGGLSVTGVTGAMAVVLPTQKIVFLTSLQEEYKTIDTWLNEAQDLSSFVAEGQTLRFPEAGAAPAVYKNRTTDVDSVEPTETVFDVPLDYYDSQNYKMRNINMHALPFDKIQYYTKLSADSIKRKEILDAAYAFAPANIGGKRIGLPTTGTLANGKRDPQLSDIVKLAMACDAAGFPDKGRNIVLPSDMWWGLINNNDILKAQLSYMQNTGVINPQMVNYYGIKIHKATNDLGVAWDIGDAAKAAQGATITGDVVKCGILFVASEVFRAEGSYDMYMVDKSQNTAGRANEFGFSHRFKADFTKSAQRYSGVLWQAQS